MRRPIVKYGDDAKSGRGGNAAFCQLTLDTFTKSSSYIGLRVYRRTVEKRGRCYQFLPALGPWAPPAERGPSLESIYRVSLTADLCEG